MTIHLTVLFSVRQARCEPQKRCPCYVVFREDTSGGGGGGGVVGPT